MFSIVGNCYRIGNEAFMISLCGPETTLQAAIAGATLFAMLVVSCILCVMFVGLFVSWIKLEAGLRRNLPNE